MLLYVLLMRNYQKLTLGTYTVKGLIYDEAKGGFYHDYRKDGLSFSVYWSASVPVSLTLNWSVLEFL